MKEYRDYLSNTSQALSRGIGLRLPLQLPDDRHEERGQGERACGEERQADAKGGEPGERGEIREVPQVLRQIGHEARKRRARLHLPGRSSREGEHGQAAVQELGLGTEGARLCVPRLGALRQLDLDDRKERNYLLSEGAF